MKLTKIQIITIISILAYAIWELYIRFWSKTQIGAIIRTDLLFVIPILSILIIVSIAQFVKSRV